MLEHITQNMNGIEIFGIFSICLFLAFFTTMLVWAALLKKSYLDSMQELPLESAEKIPNDTTSHE